MPNGGQRNGKTLPEGYKREGREEFEVEVEVGELLYIRKYISKNHEFRHSDINLHQMKSTFRCHLPDLNDVGSGTEHNKKQIRTKWLPLAELQVHRLLSEAIKRFFNGHNFNSTTSKASIKPSVPLIFTNQ